MLSVMRIEFKAFLNQQRRQLNTFLISCGLLAICLTIALLFSSLLEVITKNSQFLLPSGAQGYTLVLTSDNGNQQQLKPKAITYMRTLKLESLDHIIAVNHLNLPIEHQGTKINTQAEIVHFEGLAGVVPNVTLDQLRDIESNRSRSVILSNTFVQRLNQQFNLATGIKKGDSLMVRNQLFKVLGVANKRFSGFNTGNKNIDIWLPYHSLTFANGMPETVNLNGTFEFPGTHIYTYSSQSDEQVDAEIFWLEQVLNSVSLLPKGTALTSIKGIQDNYQYYQNNNRLILLNLFGSVVLLCLGAVNFFRFRLVQLNSEISAFTTRMALGQNSTTMALILLIQNIALLVIVFIVAFLILVVGQDSILNQLDLGIDAIDSRELIKYSLLIIPIALLLTQLQLSALLPQLNGDLTAGNTQRTTKAGHLLNILISATFFSSLLFLFMILKGFLAFEQLPYGYVSDNITVVGVEDKIMSKSMHRDYISMELIQPALQKTASNLDMEIAFASSAPMDNVDMGQMSYFIPNNLSKEQEKTAIITNHVSKDFFAVLGITLSKGRFSNHNEHNSILVNQTFANRYLTDDLTLPTTIYLDAQKIKTQEQIKIARHIVGIVEDYFPNSKKGFVEPVIFRHLGDQSVLGSIILKHSGTVDEATLNQQILSKIPGKKATTIYTLKARQKADSAEELGRMAVFMIVTLISLLIFCVGVYTHLFQFMESKKRELAIRYAIGATNGNIMQYAFTTAFWMFFPGCLLSLAAFIYIAYSEPVWLNGLTADISLLFGAASIFTLLVFVSSYLVYMTHKENAVCSDIFSGQER